ncbi:hypothetical protein SAMN04487861_10643 [Selenomonas ruminantium]|uniref:TPR repeat n=1 Tax=Selenomonas ruminantium TaxID=971 RepID=A0A1I3DEK5_SELRU|nr:tetratricopeptide repeat protein [Selenomonas ruminantium]SFH85019.1 hypothetical protein SAMN04487861_10643 [Selenomonas ruminantium]
MANELMLVKGDVFTTEERSAFEAELDKYVMRNQNNRQEINQLVFEAVATMTEADEAQAELENKSFLQRLVGGLTGSNKALQDKINKNRAAAQYAAQQTLNKLAEQNMMSYELIVAVNNKLNASLNEANEEFKNIYSGLVKFLRRSVNALVMIEERLEKIEHNVELGRWKDMIRFNELDDTEYKDLSPTGKIVCIARDFYEKTKGTWSTEDLLYIRSVMAEIGIQQKDKVNYYQVLQEINTNKAIKDKLLGDVKTLQNVKPQYMISMGVLGKLDSLSSQEKYVVETMSTFLRDKGVNITEQEVCDNLTQKYIHDIAGVNLNVDVDAYDMILDLLYNIKGLEDIDNTKIIAEETPVAMITENEEMNDFKEAEKLYLQCKFKEAAKKLTKVAENGSARAMYMLGEIYNGLLPECDCDKELARYWWYRGARERDVLCREKCDYGEREHREMELRNLADNGDMYAQFILGNDYYWDEEKGINLLLKSAEQGYFLAMEELGLLYAVNHDEKAKKWFRTAGEVGYDAGWWFLADFVNNVHEEWKCYNLAYELNGHYSGLSAIAMGDMCDNESEKVKWYNIAGQLGCSKAYYKLGKIYYGINQDGRCRLDKAIESYQKCYDFHEMFAGASAYEIGLLYKYENLSKAIEWLKKSADEGYDWGCYELGRIFYNKEDLALASYYFFKAYELKGEAQKEAEAKIRDIYLDLKANKIISDGKRDEHNMIGAALRVIMLNKINI